MCINDKYLNFKYEGVIDKSMAYGKGTRDARVSLNLSADQFVE